MLYLLTVEYEIKDKEIIVYSFLFRKKVYPIKDILYIKDEGSYYLFGKIPFGINAIVINLRNEKELVIFALKDSITFLQNIRNVQCN